MEAANVGILQRLGHRDAEQSLRRNRSDEAVAGPGCVHRRHAPSRNDEGPPLGPGHCTAAAQRHDDALAVSRLQRARDFGNARIGIVLANLHASHRPKLRLVENEDIDEIEQTALERHRWRGIEDGHGAGRPRS
jgi:hypothetical protein